MGTIVTGKDNCKLIRINLTKIDRLIIEGWVFEI
jgi:hypothetical protein